VLEAQIQEPMTEKPEVEIVPLSPEDLEILTPLLKGMGKVDNESEAAARAESMLEDPHYLLAVAKMGDGISGYVWAQNNGPHLRTGEVTARLHDLFVSPEHRGQNIGRQLFQFAVEWAKKSNVKYLQWQGSKDATAFYKSLGLEGDTKSDLEEHPFYEMEL